MKRTAFVTGGASVIGLSICQQLARAGHSVAVADFNGDGAEGAADRPAEELVKGD